MTQIARLLTLHPALLRLDIGSPMLPPFIIEQIRKREIEERVQQEQPRVELPLEPRPKPSSPHPAVEEEKRGVIIVEL